MRALRHFLSLFLLFNLRFYKRHPGRTILVLCGVALGAAVFTSVRLSVHASLQALDRSLEAVSGPAEWVISRPGRRMSDNLVRKLARHPEVEHLAPMLSVYAQEAVSGKTLRIVGVDPFLERPLRGPQAFSGDFGPWRRLFAEPWSLIVGSPAAQALGLAADDRLDLVSSAGTVSCLVAGVRDKGGLTSIDGGMVAVGDLSTVQEISGQLGRIDRINLNLRPAADPQALAERLPGGLEIHRAAQKRQTGADMARAYDFNLTMLSFVSLFVGMFLIYSLVALNAASRRFEIAVLRSLGASRRSLFCLFLIEGGGLGLLGWILAMPASALLTRALLDDVSGTVSTLFVKVAVQGVSINLWEIGLSFAVTLTVAFLSAVQPARQAMRVPPWEAMRRMEQPEQGSTGRGLLSWSGLALILAAWPISRLSSPLPWPIFPYLATFGLFIGFALTAPLLLQSLSRWVTPRISRLAGAPAFLAGRTLQQSGSRIAVSVGALITAMALFVALSIMTTSFQKTFTLWINQTISGDLFIRPLNAESNDYQDPMPKRAQAWIEQQGDRAVLLPYQRYHLIFRQMPIQVETVDIERFQNVGGFLFLSGRPDEAMAEVRSSNGLLVSESVSSQAGLKRGDAISLNLAGHTVKGTVAGIIRSYRTRGGVIFLSRSWFEQQTGVARWSGVRIFFPGSGSQRQARDFRSRLIDQTDLAPKLEMTLGSDLRQQVLSIFEDTFAVTTVLLFIALIVSGLGITTTLAVIILERKHEMATVTALGARVSQIRSLVFWEAVYLVSLGILGGFACGFILSAILVYVINKASFGWTFMYTINWAELGLAVPLCFLAAWLAALPVLRLVRRLPAALALRQE